MADDTEASAGELSDYQPVNRREFLILGGGVVMSVRELLESIGLSRNLGLTLPPPLSGSFTRSVHRREDFLTVTFDFRNLRLTNGTPKRLVKRVASQPAYMIVQFPPQHLADQAFAGSDSLAAPGDVQTRLAGPSRLAFEIPGAQLPLAFDLDTLLSWTRSPAALGACRRRTGERGSANSRAHVERDGARTAVVPHLVPVVDWRVGARA